MGEQEMMTTVDQSIEEETGNDVQSEHLPGDIHFHLKELRMGKGWSREQAAEKLGVSESTYRRMENSSTHLINDDVIVRAAQVYGVSADYLLGFTTIAAPVAPLFESLGLSVKSVRKISDSTIDRQTLNSIIEHKFFSSLMAHVSCYVRDTSLLGAVQMNTILDAACDTLQEMKGERPDRAVMIQDDLKRIKGLRITTSDQRGLFDIQREFENILNSVRKKFRKGKDFSPLMDKAAVEKYINEMVPRKIAGEKGLAAKVMKHIVGLFGRWSGMMEVLDSSDDSVIVKLNMRPKDINRITNTITEAVMK